MGLKSSALAELGGVNLQTIRYYEREGLLPAPPRLRSGYRVFPETAVQRVQFIKRAQELGFSLKEIRELLSIQIDPTKECSDVQRLAKAKVADIEARIRTLRSMKRVLSALADACPGSGPSSECPILDSIDAAGAHA
jgi:MerR family transcriptional regulator, copper efflux regulator